MKLKTSLLTLGLLAAMASVGVAQDKQQQDDKNKGHSPTPAHAAPPKARAPRNGTPPRNSPPKNNTPRPTPTNSPRTNPTPQPTVQRTGTTTRTRTHTKRTRTGTSTRGGASSMNQATFGSGSVASMARSTRFPQSHGTVHDTTAWRTNGRRDGFHPIRTGVTLGSFRYPHYLDRPRTGAYISPWYFYGSVPGYIDLGFVSGNTAINFAWGSGNSYGWQLHHRHPMGYGGFGALDYSVDAISDGFNLKQPNQFDALLPASQYVSINMSGQSPYTLSSVDFEDMLTDIINSTDTINYTVTNVWQNGNYATVEATHEYRDPDGTVERQQHWFGLVAYSPDYRIESFKSEQL